MAHTSTLQGLGFVYRAAFVAGAWLSAAACSSSSDKGASPAGTGGTPADSGKQEAGVKFKCEAPEDLKSSVDQGPTGYVLCANGMVKPMHRPEIKECATLVPRSLGCTTPGGACTQDTDCTSGPQGYCSVTQRAAVCSCYYGCKTDADCSSDRICVCGNPSGECVLAQCKSDADCGPGKLCLSSSDGHCRRIFACQTVKDLCAGDNDCPPAYSQCTFDGDHRVCKAPPNCGVAN